MKKKGLKRFCLGGVLLMAMGVWPINVLAQENDKLENNTPAKVVNQETDVGSVVNPTVGEIAKNEPAKELVPEEPVKENTDNPIEAVPENSAPAEGEAVEERPPVAECFEVLSDVDDFHAFAPRFSTPGTNNPCYFADNIFYQSGYGLPNCTAYAWGRAYELLGSKPNLSSGNANQWWGYNASQRVYSCGQSPKLGAIACWSGSACGHVAVVEAISDDRVTISESGWNSFLFRNSSYTIGSENSLYSGGFQGYLYIGDFSNEITGASVTDDLTNDNVGDAAPTAMITDVTAPTISAVEITAVSASGYTIKCRVTDDTGVDRVMFPTWTNANGQDDLDIPEKSGQALYGTITGDVVTYNVRRTEHHDEWGEYETLIDATDQAGNSACYDLSFELEDDWTTIKEKALNSNEYLSFNDALTGLATRARIQKLSLATELDK